MKFTDLPKIINFAKELVNIFQDYTFSLDNYFKEEKNREEHKELYDEYIILDKNLKDLKRKYKL